MARWHWLERRPCSCVMSLLYLPYFHDNGIKNEKINEAIIQYLPTLLIILYLIIASLLLLPHLQNNFVILIDAAINHENTVY